MSDPRRYDDHEVDAMFALAADPDDARPDATSSSMGLTLAEIQDVAREVGVDPERIATAALTLDAAPTSSPPRTIGGAPVSVSRSVELHRPLDAREWGILVGDLRETFGGGADHPANDEGRGWSLGGVEAFLEPTRDGQRLRLEARAPTALPWFVGGVVGLVLGLGLLTLFILEDLGRAANVIPTLMAFFGGVTLVAHRIRLPRWADDHGRLMEEVTERARGLSERSPSRVDDEEV